jgi:hypothetical protein
MIVFQSDPQLKAQAAFNTAIGIRSTATSSRIFRIADD